MTGEADDQLFLEDFALGQVYPGTTTLLDDAAFTGFAAITGDDHPIHYDDAYAARTKYGKRLALDGVSFAVAIVGRAMNTPRA